MAGDAAATFQPKFALLCGSWPSFPGPPVFLCVLVFRQNSAPLHCSVSPTSQFTEKEELSTAQFEGF